MNQDPVAVAQELVIRAVTLDDAEAAADLLNEVIVDGGSSLLDTPFSVTAEREFIRDFPERGVFHVAEMRADGIVGMQVLSPFGEYATHVHDHVLIMGTWVREAYRRLGIAGRLAEVSFATARERGFEKVFVDIRADNPVSLDFHRSLGFTVVGMAKRHARIGDRYVDVVFAEKFL